MIKLNLITTNKSEEIIKEYLENNVSETLAEKINHGVKITKDEQELINKKSLEDFMKYANEEARKQAEKGANYACIEDNIVFSWAIHYFEEDSIEGVLYDLNGEEYKPKIEIPKTTPNIQTYTEKTPKKEDIQLNLFDLMFNNSDKNNENKEIENTVNKIEQQPNKNENIQNDTGITMGEMYYGTSEEKPNQDETIKKLKNLFGKSLIVR